MPIGRNSGQHKREKPNRRFRRSCGKNIHLLVVLRSLCVCAIQFPGCSPCMCKSRAESLLIANTENDDARFPFQLFTTAAKSRKARELFARVSLLRFSMNFAAWWDEDYLFFNRFIVGPGATYRQKAGKKYSRRAPVVTLWLWSIDFFFCSLPPGRLEFSRSAVSLHKDARPGLLHDETRSPPDALARESPWRAAHLQTSRQDWLAHFSF